MSAFPHLFSPVAIAGLELKNRLVMSPMETGYATREGLPSSRTIAYYEARARGGVGLITLGACTVDAQHREVPRSMDFASDSVLEAHLRLTERVHEHGARIQPQLVHPGPDGLGPYLSGVPNVGPSVIPSYLTGIPCRELDASEIPPIVDLYRSAAQRVRAAGYDGIELHAAHGYMLLGSFLTPGRNRRSDEFAGNSEDGRIRLVCMVVRAIKSEVGGDFPLTLRISGYERTPAGRSLADSQRIAPKLVEAGVDAFHVSGGVIDPLTSQMVTGSHYGDAHNLPAAAAIKRVVDVPVVAVARIHSPELAERALSEGKADLVAMGRPLLADADFANKARRGHAVELRRCISCQNCIDSMEKGRMGCAVNPATGHEEEFGTPPPRAKKVVVVGGGPAGLEAARIAAERGHDVSLYEASGQLGGALLAAATVHPDNGPFLHFLRNEVKRLGVEVHLNRRLRPFEVGALQPDAVVVATGGRLKAPTIEGDDGRHVLTGPMLREMIAGRLSDGTRAKLPAWQRLLVPMLGGKLQRFLSPERLRRATRLWLPFGRQVVIVGADLAAIELAEFLAERGREVCVTSADDQIAVEVGPKRRGEHMDRLDRLGVTLLTGVRVERILPASVVIGGGRQLRADHVVLAGSVEGDTSLHDALADRVPEVFAIGDCTGLGLIHGATADAARVANAI
jgi:2,4-dienoyl-CoA reductase (NADPH2)